MIAASARRLRDRHSEPAAERGRAHRAALGAGAGAEAAIETGGYQVVFRMPGRITVATNEGAKSLRISTAKIAPELLSRAAPALDETAYLEASFKQAEEAPLLARPGLALS